MEKKQQLQEKETIKTQLKQDIEELRKDLFSKVKKDLHNIPYWIPEPVQLKDYNIQKTIDRYGQCRSADDAYSVSRQLLSEHHNEFASDYQYHKELFLETLQKRWALNKKGELHQDFVKPTCCFSHYMGLAKKSGVLLPIFDYELYFIHQMDTKNLIAFLASRGLGKTELAIVRYPSYRIMRSNEWDGRDIAITTGLAEVSAEELLIRTEDLWTDAFPDLTLKKKASELWIADTRILAFPTKNIKRLRLYDDFCAIFIDEADFYTLLDQIRLQEAVYGYILKSQPLIVFTSTPNHPNGLINQLKKKQKAKESGEEES